MALIVKFTNSSAIRKPLRGMDESKYSVDELEACDAHKYVETESGVSGPDIYYRLEDIPSHLRFEQELQAFDLYKDRLFNSAQYRYGLGENDLENLYSEQDVEDAFNN